MPTKVPVWVSLAPSTAWAMPKSMTMGSPLEMMTLPGLRSRWMTSAAWMSSMARARPPTKRVRARPRSGPWFSTVASRVGPGMYSVTTHGSSASVSASMTSATLRLRTRRMVSTSRASRARAIASPATSERSTLIATKRSCRGSCPWYTTPMPPWPMRRRMV